jgi:large repetitive protein
LVVHPKPTADAGRDTTVVAGTVLQLNGTGSGPNIIAYNWTPAQLFQGGSSSSAIGVTLPLPTTEQGGIEFVLTVFDNNLCTDSDTVVVTTEGAPASLLIPNLITPNGDGKNDVLIIPFIEQLGEYVFNIYGRGGALLFTTRSYENNWDGTYEGSPLPDGPYWYLIRTPEGFEYKGAVTILR